MFEILSPCCRWTSFTPAGVGVFFGHGCFLLLGVASAENDRKNDAEFAKDWWFERRGCTVEENDAVETRDAVETHAVGFQDLGATFGGGFPADWPQQCLDDFYALDGYLFGGKNKPTKTLADTDEGACCAACAHEKRTCIDAPGTDGTVHA